MDQIDWVALLIGDFYHFRLVRHLLLVVVNLQLVAYFDGEIGHRSTGRTDTLPSATASPRSRSVARSSVTTVATATPSVRTATLRGLFFLLHTTASSRVATTTTTTSACTAFTVVLLGVQRIGILALPATPFDRVR